MQRAQVELLPAEVRDELNRKLIASAFSGYSGLADWLQERGFAISRSALHRHGQALERKLAAIRASTQAATAIAEAAPDDADVRSAAVMSLVQTEMFDLMVTLQELEAESDPAERVKMLARIAKAVAELSRASVGQKRWAAEVRGKIGKRLDVVEAEAKAGTAPRDPLELLRRVREEVYGLV